MSKPTLAIAHIVARTPNIARVTRFYCTLGLRKIWENERMAIIELRGGTHMLFFKRAGKFKKPPKADFDFMVDDIRKFHARLKRAKLPAGKMWSNELSGHTMFETKDPDGRVITVYSSHTEGRSV